MISLTFNTPNLSQKCFVNLWHIYCETFNYCYETNQLFNDIFYFRLKFLCLGGNHLSEVPGTLGMLDNLKALNLSDNALESLPPAIANLKHLKSLMLHKNRLRTLPVEIISLKCLSEVNTFELKSLSFNYFYVKITFYGLLWLLIVCLRWSTNSGGRGFLRYNTLSKYSTLIRDTILQICY